MILGWFRRPAFSVASLLVLGLALRAYHYVRDPAVWHDEAAVLVNVIPLGFAELLGPLRHAEAAPPLFLWLERATALVLGDSTLALRLPAALAGSAALVFAVWATWREVGPSAAVIAAVLLAASDRLLWHGCEAKPYAFDVLCSAGLLLAFSATKDWPLVRQVGLFLPLVPVVIWVSYPGCFVCGGLLLALLPTACREVRWRSLIAWAALALIIVGSFAALYFGPARAQRCGAMESCWTGQFPQWDRPWTVPIWTVASTFDALRYCFMPCGYLLAVFIAAGAARLWRAGRADLVTLALAPFGLNLVAAWLHGYPFGAARVVVHAAPGLTLVAAAGVGPCVDWLRARARPIAAVAAIVLALPVALSLYRVAVPWPRADTAAASAYVLAHRSGDERVFANHWEYEYYFRGLGVQFSYLPPDLAVPPAPIWVVVTSARLRDREVILGIVGQGRRFSDRRDFAGTVAARFAQPRDSATPAESVSALPPPPAAQSGRPHTRP